MARNGLDSLIDGGNGAVGGRGRGSQMAGFLSAIPFIDGIPEAIAQIFGGIVCGILLHRFWGSLTNWIPFSFPKSLPGFLLILIILYMIDKAKGWSFVPFFKQDTWCHLFLGILINLAIGTWF